MLARSGSGFARLVLERAREAEFAKMSSNLRTHLFLVTRAAWERFKFLIKRVGDSRSFPLPSRVFNYALLSITVQATLINFGIVPLSLPKCVCTLDEK